MKRTPWYRGFQQPARSGMYEAQTLYMRCNCCVTMMRWDATTREWFTNTCSPPGRYTTHYFGKLRRWRGLTKSTRGTPHG